MTKGFRLSARNTFATLPRLFATSSYASLSGPSAPATSFASMRAMRHPPGQGRRCPSRFGPLVSVRLEEADLADLEIVLEVHEKGRPPSSEVAEALSVPVEPAVPEVHARAGRLRFEVPCGGAGARPRQGERAPWLQRQDVCDRGAPSVSPAGAEVDVRCTAARRPLLEMVALRQGLEDLLRRDIDEDHETEFLVLDGRVLRTQRISPTFADRLQVPEAHTVRVEDRPAWSFGLRDAGVDEGESRHLAVLF